ncbi:MAG: Maf family protein [Chitinophagales bacterium]|nr:Maf family protein [Chitinophagales bacterium]
MIHKEGLILGSGSPRRKEILELAEIEFEVLVSNVDESFSAETPIRNVAEQLAVRKAKAIQTQFKIVDRPILAADTTVIVENEILNKAESKWEAIRMIQKLSNRTHEVITGVCCLKDDILISFKDITRVTFTEIPQFYIEYYVDTFQPFDKAGAYAIQEWLGVRYVSKIEGSYYNVMGLPLPKIIQELGW